MLLLLGQGNNPLNNTGWREYVQRLICNLHTKPGHEAEVIRDLLKEAYNDANWIVDNDEGVVYVSEGNDYDDEGAAFCCF